MDNRKYEIFQAMVFKWHAPGRASFPLPWLPFLIPTSILEDASEFSNTKQPTPTLTFAVAAIFSNRAGWHFILYLVRSHYLNTTH